MTMEELAAFRQQYSKKTVNLDGIDWNYYDIGDSNAGLALVFLHGTTGSAEIFWQQLTFFQEQYRVISFDLPPVTGVDNLVHGINHVLTGSGVKEIVILGTSFGGFVAQHYCYMYAETIKGLVLSNTFLSTGVYANQYSRLVRMEKLIPTFMIKRIMLKSLLTINHEMTRRYLVEQLEAFSKKILISRLKSFIGITITKAPVDKVLVIETLEDPLVPEELQQDLRENYPRATVKSLDKDANHFPYLIKGAEYNRILMEFLETI